MFRLFNAWMTSSDNGSGAKESNTDALMHELGWTKTSRGWAGRFKTNHGQWPGIVELAGDRVKAYIRYLPEELRLQRHGLSFREQASGWFLIEMTVSPVDPDPIAVIRHIERKIVSPGDAVSVNVQGVKEAA